MNRRRIPTNVFQDGSEQYPFLIKTPQDFLAFKNENLAGNTFNGVFHKLANDLDFSGVTVPISTIQWGKNYYGNFNGNFKKIKNWTQTFIGTVRGVHGLFSANFGTIKNLFIDNCNITIQIGTTDNNNFIGIGLICPNNYGIIEKSIVTGIVSRNSFAGSVGGICGSNSTNINNCFTNILINGSDGNAVGGICGFLGAANHLIENCLSMGNVTVNSGSYIGGICGNSNTAVGTLKNCIAAMNEINSSSTTGINRISPTTSTLINNYALNAMIVRGATVSGGTATNGNGDNATIQQLKSLALYRDTMGWDMINIWEIDDGIDFPRLRGFNY